jgi:hypothetical protein
MITSRQILQYFHPILKIQSLTATIALQAKERN